MMRSFKKLVKIQYIGLVVTLILILACFSNASAEVEITHEQVTDPGIFTSNPSLAVFQNKLLNALSGSSEEQLEVVEVIPLKRILYVGEEGASMEPEESAYVNYCGPSSTRLALSLHLNDLPSLDDIGACENINPDWGVLMPDVTRCLNSYLGEQHYQTGSAASKEQFFEWIKSDIDSGYALITGLRTANIAGWSYNDVHHIIAIVGYDISYENSNDIQLYYVDVSSSMAGYIGSYFNTQDLSWVWDQVKLNNTQSW